MGGGHSRRRSQEPISIPNFPYPSNIFSYLMSQSGGYKITFTTPDGQTNNVTMPPDVTPANTTPSTLATAAPTTTPAPTTQPAFYTRTTPPTPTNGTGTATATDAGVEDVKWPEGIGEKEKYIQLPTIQPGVPPIWKAAIWAMSYINLFQTNPPITDYATLNDVYVTLAGRTKYFMEDGETKKGQPNQKNIAAMIYFCTVTSILFKPFTENFTYNYLNATFPNIFNDTTTPSGEQITGAMIYAKVIMINSYATNMISMLRKYNIGGNGYIGPGDRVMVYAAPAVLNNLLTQLIDVDPLAIVNDPNPLDLLNL
jgi:hypothetical protein